MHVYINTPLPLRILTSHFIISGATYPNNKWFTLSIRYNISLFHKSGWEKKSKDMLSVIVYIYVPDISPTSERTLALRLLYQRFLYCTLCERDILDWSGDDSYFILNKIFVFQKSRILDKNTQQIRHDEFNSWK